MRIQVQWHPQHQLNQPRARHKVYPETIQLNETHPIRRVTTDNEALRGTKYTGEVPPEWEEGLPLPRPPKGLPARKKSPDPICPP